MGKDIATRLNGVTAKEQARAILRKIQVDILDGNFSN
jgi:hypothetical protein